MNRQSGAEPYEPPEGDNMCDTTDVTYESSAEAGEIVEFYEEQGFKLLGDAAGTLDGSLNNSLGQPRPTTKRGHLGGV